MALVVWLFAGGGEAEIQGLVPFLNRWFGRRLSRRYLKGNLCAENRLHQTQLARVQTRPKVAE
jgi:hypothetical protein